MFTPLRGNELSFLQEGYSRVAMLVASEKHEQAENTMTDLIHRLQALKPRSGDPQEQQHHERALSECYVNLASCLFNREDCEDNFLRMKSLLEQAILLDSLSHWGYFNLASYYYRTNSYAEALENLHCCLSCLYLLKAVLSRDIENRNREIDLGRAIGYCQNNLQARYIRLLMQLKQNRWKMAANEVELALEAQEGEANELAELKTMLITLSTNPQPAEGRALLKRAMELLIRLPTQKNRLRGSVRVEEEKNALAKEIEDKMVEFNDLFRQVNDLGSAQNLFMLKALHRTGRSEKRIHILSNTVQPPVPQEIKLVESTPFRPNSIELEAKVIERMNQSKKSLTESKGYGESLFELTKSQNLENSNKVLGSLLSSLMNNPKPFRVLPSEVEELDNENQTLNDNNSIRKNFEIQAIESEIQPLPENESALLSGCDPKLTSQPCLIEDDDLLLDSLYDRDFKKTKHAEGTALIPQIRSMRQQELSSSLYPLGESSSKVLELVLLKAEFREELKEKFVGIYAHLEYNSGFIETYKFRSRQVSSQNSEVEWGESLGFIRLAEEPKSMVVKVFKSEPYYYNDKFLGEGEIEVTAVGVIKIPLYLNVRSVGSASIRLLPGEQGQGLNSSFKRSATSNSNFSSSIKSESQNSQHS